MLTCKEISQLATEYAEGALDADTRRGFEEHLAGCQACEAWVRQLQVVARAVHELPTPELPPAVQAELLKRFDDWHARRVPAAGLRHPGSSTAPSRWSAPLAALAVATAGGALVALARSPSHSPYDWAIGAGIAGAGLALAGWMRRLTPGFALAAAATALLAAWLRGGPGALSLRGGLDCLLTEAGMAAGASGAAWLLLRRQAAGPLGSAMGAWAVAGTLVGDAALQVTCAHQGSLPHLVVFHAGGVLAVIGAAWLQARLAAQATGGRPT